MSDLLGKLLGIKDFAETPAYYDIPPEHDPFTAEIERRFGVAPPALRAFATTLFGDRSPITEKFFTQRELDALRAASTRQLDKGKAYIGYGDYGEMNPWADGSQAILNALSDPNHSLAFTLGMANVARDDGGAININDNYHFAAPSKLVEPYRTPQGAAYLLLHGLLNNGLLGVGNVIGNYVAPQDMGRDVKINIPGGLKENQ